MRSIVHQLTRIFAASLLTLGACGGDSTNDDAGADATQGTDSGSDVATNDSGSDSTPTSDACVPVDGGLACDGLHIACGNNLCDAGAQVCCINDGGTKETCTVAPVTDSGKPPPPNACTGTSMTCDEAADCPSGQICCGFVGSAGGFATKCQTSCGTGLQFCHGSAECLTGECTVQTQCHGVTIETCSAFCP